MLADRPNFFYSQPGSPGSSSGPTLGTALGSYEQLGQTLAETARFLNQKQPGLVNEHTHLFTTVEELLASDYARQHPFTAEQIASLRTAEGFHDTETGHSFVIAENTRLLPGESPQQALTRVLLHERVGHGGMHILLGGAESARSRRWAALSAQIPPAELGAIAAETGYGHLAGRHEDLAFEWFARRTEKDLNLLGKSSLPRQMWDAFREMVLDFMASLDLKPTLGRSFETQVKDLQRRAREAALRPVRDSTNVRQVAPDSFHPQATPDRRSVTSLDDVNHLFTSPSNNPHDGSLAPHLPSLPPIWQGRARHGEDAAVLGRNPDGTFQVRLNGTEKTFKESQVAAMTGMQRGPLYAHLAQATRQQLALPHPPSLPPIWQGRARHGENAAVLGRNPDGTFQVRLNGAEKTFKESQVAAMTGMQRGPLYEMLERATEQEAARRGSVLLESELLGKSLPPTKQKKLFQAKMNDSPTAGGHLTPGLPPNQSPRSLAELQAALQPLVKESDKYAQRWDEVQSRLEIVRDAIKPKPGQPSKPSFLYAAAEIANRSRLGEELRSLMEEERVLRQEQDGLAAEARAILAIPESERGKVRFIGDHLENLTPELAKAWKTAREGALIVEQYVHPGLLPELGVHVAFHNRSSYTHRNDSGDLERTTYLTPAAGVITAAHEITHAIECQEVEGVVNGQRVIRQPLYEKARKFLLARARGIPPQKLQDLAPDDNYRAHETAFEDDWLNKGGEHYTGRDYAHAMTEIFTMGLQRMHDDPVRFFSEDPEHFAIILQLRYPIQL